MSNPTPTVTQDQALDHLGPRVSEAGRGEPDAGELQAAPYTVCFQMPGSTIQEFTGVVLDSFSVTLGEPALMEFMLDGEAVLVLPAATFVYARREAPAVEPDSSQPLSKQD